MLPVASATPAGEDPVVVHPGTGDPSGDEFPVDDTRHQAHGPLGMNEGDLDDDDVRAARRGDETIASPTTTCPAG